MKYSKLKFRQRQPEESIAYASELFIITPKCFKIKARKIRYSFNCTAIMYKRFVGTETNTIIKLAVYKGTSTNPGNVCCRMNCIYR